jgi:transcriptional regulator with XRE-family HTH domain
MFLKGGQRLMNQIKIGEFLKELRKEKGLTQEQLAEQFNVSRRSVSRWETGSNMPDISLLVEIAEFYDTSIPEIINGERKSEKMNEEVKEVAETMSNYAGAEKESIVKNIRGLSFIGLAAFMIYFLLDVTGVFENNGLLEYLYVYSEVLIYVTVLLIPLYTTGLLGKIQRKSMNSKFNNLPRIVRIVVAIVAGMSVTVILKLALTGVFG